MKIARTIGIGFGWSLWAVSVIALIVLLSGCAQTHTASFNRSPLDGYGCTFSPDGKPLSYPCIDNRMDQSLDPERYAQWGRIKLDGLVAHSRVDAVFDICNGQYACKIGDSYHVTAGDVSALVYLANKQITNQ